MNLSRLESFAAETRTRLEELVANKLEHVRNPESDEYRAYPKLIANLEKAVKETSLQSVIERVAYEWFNRFCALRFLDVHRYGRTLVISPAEGETMPQILSDAQNGIYPHSLSDEKRDRCIDLFTGKISSHDRFNAVYRILFLDACNDWNAYLPFLFEPVADYTELLLPDDLLSKDSIPARVVETLDAASCEHVEVIGWLYQFYVAKQKAKVFEALKKNKKIEKENIPAATELFTPNWIVKFLVQNSVGQLLARLQPAAGFQSALRYFVPEEPMPNTDDVKLEELKICDPCCGSGHMLVEAFDLLFTAYENAGYESLDIPRLILENNIHGLELDERAAALASFCLMMKVLEHDPRFFKKRENREHPLVPKVIALKAYSFTPEEITAYRNEVKSDLFSEPVVRLMNIFENADTLGSLIDPAAEVSAELIASFKAQNDPDNLFIRSTHERFLKVLRQAEFLTPRYHVVVTNPPYMGGKGMNELLTNFARTNYPNSKSDLFAMFIERCLALTRPQGYAALVTMQSWMFLSSYENLRKKLLTEKTITTMAHIGTRGFDSIGGEVVSTTAFVLTNRFISDYKGAYIRLVDGMNEAEKEQMLVEAIS